MTDKSKPIVQNILPRAKKSLGQHFLRNPEICSRIIDLLNPTEMDDIVEIGPGFGALSRLLQAIPHHELLLLEKDKDLAHALRAQNYINVTIINIDALKFPWRNISSSWKIIGNLPYNVASPLIWNIVSQSQGPQKMVFMVQKEVAERLTATTGTKNYGALSVWAQSFSKTKYEFTLKPGSFTPPPKVDSAVVSFLPRAERPANPEALRRILNLCFQNRRKQLGTIFKTYNPILLNCLSENNLDASLRPENLSPADFQILANFYVKNISETSA